MGHGQGGESFLDIDCPHNLTHSLVLIGCEKPTNLAQRYSGGSPPRIAACLPPPHSLVASNHFGREGYRFCWFAVESRVIGKAVGEGGARRAPRGAGAGAGGKCDVSYCLYFSLCFIFQYVFIYIHFYIFLVRFLFSGLWI